MIFFLKEKRFSHTSLKLYNSLSFFLNKDFFIIAYSQDNFICDVCFHDNGFHERESASAIPTYAIPTSTSTVSAPAAAQNSLLNQVLTGQALEE
ncbi:unnamed protein product [Rhizophagus irregularis]|nr:unnamed protein product [Rhizophagus irregularis]CAB4431694.1 unnamed protein product [Rhizophagus irregularis]